MDDTGLKYNFYHKEYMINETRVSCVTKEVRVALGQFGRRRRKIAALAISAAQGR
jgi:hypothetical protein